MPRSISLLALLASLTLASPTSAEVDDVVGATQDANGNVVTIIDAGDGTCHYWHCEQGIGCFKVQVECPFVYVPEDYVPEEPGDEGFLCAGAGMVCGWITFDTSIPDPSDVAWPKWVCYGVAGSVAGAILWCSGDDLADQAREIQAAIDRLYEMLQNERGAQRREEIMETIVRLQEQLRRLFD